MPPTRFRLPVKTRLKQHMNPVFEYTAFIDLLILIWLQFPASHIRLSLVQQKGLSGWLTSASAESIKHLGNKKVGLWALGCLISFLRAWSAFTWSIHFVHTASLFFVNVYQSHRHVINFWPQIFCDQFVSALLLRTFGDAFLPNCSGTHPLTNWIKFAATLVLRHEAYLPSFH